MTTLDKKRKHIVIILTGLTVSIIAFLCIPVPKFNTPYSTVLTSSDGHLLGAKIADDGQWRFPATNSYSAKYIRCVTEFEDKYFFYHLGFNPISLINATIDNIKQKKVVRGGSTLSMQVVRLSRNNKKRSYGEKFIEIILALHLEFRYSKDEIFALYAANAPFGGNVVGIDAASWRYFNTSPDKLSWSEAATLAVLPNSPALIHPGKNREYLQLKRDKLLKNMTLSKPKLPKRLKESTLYSEKDFELALMETIPEKPFSIPQEAYHYLSELEKTNKGKLIKSKIDYNLQNTVNQIIKAHYKNNSENGIENCGVYIFNYTNNETVCYSGNYIEAIDAAMVDMVKAQRSTGSILKPFLYAAMLDDGELLPEMVLPDIPINIAGYTPKNYSDTFSGAVKADNALSNSLNTPFVYLLRKYGVSKFYNILKQLQLSGLTFSADHYGLSLILGGGEASLFDIVNAYGLMAQSLKNDNTNSNFFNSLTDSIPTSSPFSPAAIYLTFQAMEKVNRPYSQTGWMHFTSSHKIAWKTGTSFGFKDAWSIGIVDDYVIGVWVGNSDGEGRPGLTGLNVAAPILFDIVNYLNVDFTLDDKNCDFTEIEVCSESGYPKSPYCRNTKTIKVPNCELMTGTCPYHKKIFLDKTRQYRVFPDCYDVDINNYDIYYVLPPSMEWYYKKVTPTYKSLPQLYPGCHNSNDEKIMSFIYPEENLTLIIPTGIQGNLQSIIFEIAHRNPDKTVFWNLNDRYLGKTKYIHQMAVQNESGNYTLRCIDEDGNVIVRNFKIENHD